MMRRGTRVGDYRIRREVGPSARGMFYVATHVGSGRVAMLELVDADEAMAAQIATEQRAARLVPHRGIIDVLQTGTSPHGHWVATEWLRGESLPTRLARKRLSMREVDQIFTQLVDLVGAFQRMSLVHGRLDISQVVLEKTAANTTRVRLLDFAILRKADKLFGAFSANAKDDARATAERTADITRGLNVDILALGKLLDACIPRRTPWRDDPVEQQYRRIAKLCAAREPGKQPRSCDELARLVSLATVDVGRTPKSGQWLLAAVVVLLLAAFGLVVVRGVSMRHADVAEGRE
ncbi:MAG TPA: serine/threonine-protein kinase [Polyangiales bacterium]